MEEEILPGDLDTGDMIMLTGGGDELLVKAVRLGQGGFILTVSPADDDTLGAKRFITLTAATGDQLRCHEHLGALIKFRNEDPRGERAPTRQLCAFPGAAAGRPNAYPNGRCVT